MDFAHIPVLLNETITGLDIKENGIYVDCTAGGGGHSGEILKHLTTGKLISIDQDPDAISTLTEKFKKNENSIIVMGNFGNMKDLLELRGVVVNTLPFEDLRKIIFEYGEEKYANSIARAIVAQREQKPITTTLELAEIVKANVPQKVRRDGHPARKTFQAIRIAVNDELTVLEKGLDDAFSMLSKGGRLAVITFHSLEDRIVKQKMAGWCQGCTCPKDFPVCVCGNKPKARLVNRKPVCANETELTQNPRARSAKLRICEKI